MLTYELVSLCRIEPLMPSWRGSPAELTTRGYNNEPRSRFSKIPPTHHLINRIFVI
jgi:hypothetical protein